MKTKTVFLGCGALLLIGCLALVLTLFIGGKSFFRYGVGTDLSDYRDAILALETTRSEAATVVSDLEILRQSVSEQNHFGFFEWIEIDDSIRGLLLDGKLEDPEWKILRDQIDQMMQTQMLSR